MDLDMYTTKNKLLISATNFPTFSALCEQAQREAEQLQRTLHQLYCLDFEFELSVQDRTQETRSGTMERYPSHE
ncbi:MAG: hypothetical protein LUC48_09745 [Clostridiales bacterium]|nr:hypothetical protein [Clostridiales bacterium]